MGIREGYGLVQLMMSIQTHRLLLVLCVRSVSICSAVILKEKMLQSKFRFYHIQIINSQDPDKCQQLNCHQSFVNHPERNKCEGNVKIHF